MELKAFLLIAKAFRGSQDHCLSKAEVLKAAAQTFRIGPKFSKAVLDMIKNQDQYNVKNDFKQMRECQQYQLTDQDLTAFDDIFSPGFKYVPNMDKVRIKEDRMINRDGWQQLDFNFLQKMLRVKENSMVRFSKLLRARQPIQRSQIYSIRRALIEQANKILKNNGVLSDSDEYSEE